VTRIEKSATRIRMPKGGGDASGEGRLFRCQQDVSALRDTPHPEVRTCDTCAQSVFLANDVEGFERWAASDRCVWLDSGGLVVGRPASSPDDGPGRTLGWDEV